PSRRTAAAGHRRPGSAGLLAPPRPRAAGRSAPPSAAGLRPPARAGSCDQPSENGQELRPLRPELLEGMAGEPLENFFPPRPELDEHAAPGSRVAGGCHHAAPGEAGDPPDRAVMPKLEPLRESADGGGSARETLELEEEQVLLRRHARLLGGDLPRAQEAADVVAELSEGPVVNPPAEGGPAAGA